LFFETLNAVLYLANINGMVLHSQTLYVTQVSAYLFIYLLLYALISSRALAVCLFNFVLCVLFQYFCIPSCDSYRIQHLYEFLFQVHSVHLCYLQQLAVFHLNMWWLRFRWCNLTVKENIHAPARATLLPRHSTKEDPSNFTLDFLPIVSGLFLISWYYSCLWFLLLI